MRLHLLGLFHTKTSIAYSHCAFTGKVLRFSKMMQDHGYEVIEYSNEGSESTANKHVAMLADNEFNALYGNRKEVDFHGDDATVGSKGHALFEERLIPALKENLEKEDIICHPFGHAHSRLLTEFPNHQHVETGIGYPTLMSNSFRIFESYAWMHYHQGKENRQGKNYEWVVPNYFDLDDWEPSYEPGQYLAFLGRICSAKGMDTIKELANYSPWPIVLHGQGDPSPWHHPNIIYKGPITGKKRSDFLRGARAALMPTNFTEPFGGSGVEAMLCGTPLIAVDYGAFTETIIDGVTGYRCHTLQEWIDAIHKAGDLDRKKIADITRSKYSLEACGKKYDKIFKSLNDLYRGGWYQLREPSEINYVHLDAEERPFAERLTTWIKENLDPAYVLDLGCGPGTYVDCFIEKGIDCIGYDTDLRVEGKEHLLCKSLFDVEHTAPVVLCMEVAEHIDGLENQRITKAMNQALESNGILIWTAARPGQGGVKHINCQTKDYWEQQLKCVGLIREVELEAKLISFIEKGYHMGWFLQNLLVFRKP